jgi:hypothetical protein
MEFGCGNKNMGMWVGKNKKKGGWVGFTRWNGQNLLKNKMVKLGVCRPQKHPITTHLFSDSNIIDTVRLCLFFGEILSGKNCLFFVLVWPGYVWYRSGINLNFSLIEYRGTRRDLCKPICGLENLRNLFKLFGGHVESRDPLPKLVSCELLFQIFLPQEVSGMEIPTRLVWLNSHNRKKCLVPSLMERNS